MRRALLLSRITIIAAVIGRRRSVTEATRRPPYTALLGRAFDAPAPNRIWVADITYLATQEGWLYLAVVLDLYARRVMGWSMQSTLEGSLVIATLTDAIGHRQPLSVFPSRTAARTAVFDFSSASTIGDGVGVDLIRWSTAA